MVSHPVILLALIFVLAVVGSAMRAKRRCVERCEIFARRAAGLFSLFSDLLGLPVDAGNCVLLAGVGGNDSGDCAPSQQRS